MGGIEGRAINETSEIAKQKAAARASARRALSALSAETRVAASEVIQRRILELDAFRRARVVALYRALPREVTLSRLLAVCRAEGKVIVLPTWNAARKAYGLARWDAGMPLAVGAFGIEEPMEKIWTPCSAVDFITVTCLAFDARRYRLGHGGGHFDRLLAEMRGTTACLAFSCQKVASVPIEPHDIRLDLIATESALYSGA